MSRPGLQAGWIAAALRTELPGLGLVSSELPAPKLRRSPAGVREHLDALAVRFRGADALVLRQRPVPHAYRVFFRHVGLDPDVTRVPVEAAWMERLVHGGFRSQGLLDDALTIALVETGVPVWALDADTLDGPLGLRLAEEQERLGGEADGVALPAGRIVVADATAPVAPLFDAAAVGRRVTRRTHRMLLFAVHVAGISAMQIEEALWMCAETLGAR
ncbi:MAG TPA: phenylalanine--tRNA ligase beta subunit-related protein [Conexibacter sp.]|nr:phenylalanine--tRNA ligase beta subunit-related protein [Conexibacter sp.]